MKALIWREWLRIKYPALAGLAILLGYLIAHALLWSAADRNLAGLAGALTGLLLVAALAVAPVLVTAERARREDEFAHSWPVSPLAVWAARLMVGASALAIFWLLLAGVARIAVRLSPGDPAALAVSSPAVLPVSAAAAFALFGVSFLTAHFGRWQIAAVVVPPMTCVLIAAGYERIINAAGFLWGPRIGIHPEALLYQWPILCWLLVGGGIAALIASAIAATARFRVAGVESTRSMAAAVMLLLVVPVIVLGWSALGGGPDPSGMRSFYADTVDDGRHVLIWEMWTPFPDADPHLEHTAIFPRLWLMDAEGSNLRCVGRSPSWPTRQGPVSSLMIFVWGNDTGGPFARRIWALDTRSGGLQPVPVDLGGTNAMNLRPVLSADGTLLCVPPMVLRVNDALRPLPVRLPDDLDWPLGFSPDNALLYVGREPKGPDVSALELATGELTEVATAPDDASSAPALSPDARWVSWYAPNGQPGGQRPCEDLALARISDGHRVRISGGDAASMLWSPDGRYLWVTTRQGLRVWRHPGDEPVTTATPAKLGGWTEAREAVWSGDGRVAFVVHRLADDQSRADEYQPLFTSIWTADVTGAGMRPIPGTEAISYRPPVVVGWRPDGRLLVEGWETLVAIDPETGAREELLEAQRASEYASNAHWDPPTGENAP